VPAHGFFAGLIDCNFLHGWLPPPKYVIRCLFIDDYSCLHIRFSK
jgi:hypothetical protein